MKKMRQFYFLIAVQIVFLTGCVFGGFSPNSQGALIIGASKDGEEDKTSNRSRDLKGKCEDDNDCIDICEDTYGEFSSDSDEENEGRVERCLDLSYSVVDSFEDIVEALEDPAYSKFQNLETRNFGHFLNVSVKPWIEYIKDMRRSDSEIVLRWIASERRVADGIVTAYSNYEDIEQYDGVFKLLMDLAPDLSDDSNYQGNTDADRTRRNCAELCCAIVVSETGGNKSFKDIFDETRNSEAEDIALELIKDVCSVDSGTIDTENGADGICTPHKSYCHPN